MNPVLSDMSELIIINSAEELQNDFILIHPEELDPSVIDFSKYTLLLARGVSAAPINVNSRNFQQLSSEGYVMSVNISFDDTHLGGVRWQDAILVNKLEKNANVKLVVTMNDIN